MILHSQVVEQAIDAGRRGRFVKELVLARGAMPLAMVRKRRTAAAVAAAGEAPAGHTGVAAPTDASVLLIHGYGQNRHAFHLPARSLANHLAAAGFDVFNLDLRGHGRSAHLGARRPHGVEELIREDVPTALDEIQRLAGRRPVFLVGHSLGGVIGYCTAVERPDAVAGVVSLGSPYHFTVGARLLAGLGEAFLLLDRAFGLPNLAVPTRAYGSLVRAGRRLVDSRLWPVPLRGFRRGSLEPEVLEQHMALAMDRGSIGTMRAMFAWASEARARRGEADGMFGYARRFEALATPLLVVAGRHDDLAPPASVLPAYQRSRSPDRTYRELPFGHIDLLIGREAPQLTWPLVEAWIGSRARRLEQRAGGERDRAA
jgi:pimeloyl-ACP methyl ester carboxylesterase